MGKKVASNHSDLTSGGTGAHPRVIVTLDLGALELSMDQLLGLRALDKVTCTWDAPLSGMIRLNGAPWASVDISITQVAQPSGAPVTILELVVSELATCLRAASQDEQGTAADHRKR